MLVAKFIRNLPQFVVVTFLGAVVLVPVHIGYGVQHDVIMDVMLVQMGAYDSLKIRKTAFHKFDADLMGKLRRCFAGSEGLHHMKALYAVRLTPALFRILHFIPCRFDAIQIDGGLKQAGASFFSVQRIGNIGGHAGFLGSFTVIGGFDGIDGVIHGFVHPGVANRTDPDICQSDELLCSGEKILVAIQQAHDLALIYEALIHSILCDGIEQLALTSDFLKQLDAIAMGTLPDFLAHDELAKIHFAGKAGLFDLLLQMMEFTAVQTDNNGMISFPQRSTPLFFVFVVFFWVCADSI